MCSMPSLYTQRGSLDRHRMTWSERYRTGNLTIDRQHCQLFTLINKGRHAAGLIPPDMTEMQRVVAELRTYARVHFTTEESLMRDRGYPSLSQHRRAHQSMLMRVDELALEATALPAVTVAERLRGLLDHFVDHHLSQHDQALVTWLDHNQIG